MSIGLHSWSKTFLSEFSLSFAFLEVFLGGGGAAYTRKCSLLLLLLLLLLSFLKMSFIKKYVTDDDVK